MIRPVVVVVVGLYHAIVVVVRPASRTVSIAAVHRVGAVVVVVVLLVWYGERVLVVVVVVVVVVHCTRPLDARTQSWMSCSSNCCSVAADSFYGGIDTRVSPSLPNRATTTTSSCAVPNGLVVVDTQVVMCKHFACVVDSIACHRQRSAVAVL